MANLPAKSVYISKLLQQVGMVGGLGLAVGAALGSVAYLMVKVNGFGDQTFLPYFGGTVGLGLGAMFATKKATLYHHSFVAGVRRALEMSAQGLDSEVEQRQRLMEAQSNSDVVLDKALRNAGFNEGLKGMSFYADRATGTLMLPGKLVDINGNAYGMHAQTTNARSGTVGAIAAEKAAQRQAAVMGTVSALAPHRSGSSRPQDFSSSSEYGDDSPQLNTDGTLMLEGGSVDTNGNAYGTVL